MLKYQNKTIKQLWSIYLYKVYLPTHAVCVSLCVKCKGGCWHTLSLCITRLSRSHEVTQSSFRPQSHPKAIGSGATDPKAIGSGASNAALLTMCLDLSPNSHLTAIGSGPRGKWFSRTYLRCICQHRTEYLSLVDLWSNTHWSPAAW